MRFLAGMLIGGIIGWLIAPDGDDDLPHSKKKHYMTDNLVANLKNDYAALKHGNEGRSGQQISQDILNAVSLIEYLQQVRDRK